MRNDTIWVFNAGNAFSGNPKWFFLFLEHNHPEIEKHWLCYDRKLVDYMKSRGYRAHLYQSKSGKDICKRAGVYVVNQVKEIIQPELVGVKILNLWHGVGCKTVERKVNFGFLAERIAKKYIQNTEIYKTYQMFLVTSPLMEEHFIKQCGLERSMLIRAGYPCCIRNEAANSFDHDIRRRKGLGPDTKIAVYSPTYRDGSATDFFLKAIPDMGRLVKTLEENNILLIFKMHPLMMGDSHYLAAMKQYQDCRYVEFWNNEDDIYEIFSDIDLAIIDYSSIFYDMLAAGVKSFARYMFDIDDKNNLRDFVFDVREMTCGYDCNDFDQLLDMLAHMERITEVGGEEKERIYDLFWAYAREHGNEEIFRAIMEFRPVEKQLPTLYTFDIFDTLIKRRTLAPVGIFYYIQDEILKSGLEFPSLCKTAFPRIRMQSEANVREWYKKTAYRREEDRLEISLREIYDRMAEVYGLTEEQIAFCMQTEIQAEIDNVIPYTEHIAYVKELLARGETVLLLSDMYLSKEVITAMLAKADPVLTELPLYLSNELGVQKTTRKLFLKAYSDFEDYPFKEWLHYGDSPVADLREPRKLGIKTVNHAMDAFSEYEKKLVEEIRSYDSYLAAACMARKRMTLGDPDASNRDLFVYEFASLVLVPYVAWAVADAVKRGIDTLYFISRDGHYLKLMADAYIQAKGLKLKTKYIYGSRKAWRIPSFVTEIDAEFFTPFGNLAKLTSFDALLKALDMDEQRFLAMFPELADLKVHFHYTPKLMNDLRTKFKQSEAYRRYLLEQAAKERTIVLQYLRQEIDFNEKFAFVEYWGRGYTQTCLTRLLQEAAGRPLPDPFYYARSIYGTEGNDIRYNFTTSHRSLIYVEAIFANLPYRSISEYQEVNGVIEPVIRPCDNDKELHRALEEQLAAFATDVYSQKLQDEERLNKDLYHYAMEYYTNSTDDPMLVGNIAHLKDSVEQYGAALEFAPAITCKSIVNSLFRARYFRTKSVKMSLARSNVLFRHAYRWYKANQRNGKLVKTLKKVMKKLRRR